MINVMEELEHYDINVIQDEILIDDTITTMLSVFNKAVDKIAKMQYQSLNNIDTVVDLMDEMKEIDERVAFVKDKNQLLEDEKKSLVCLLIEVGDLLEDIYIFSLQSSNEGLKSQMQLQWNQMEQALLGNQMVRFGNREELFDTRLHIAKEIKDDHQFPDINQAKILEVIKSGYLYKGQLIRKAEVVINKG